MEADTTSSSADELRVCTRIGIAEGHTLLRFGMTNFVGSLEGFTNAWQAGSASETLHHVEREPPAILILDMALPGRNGIDLIKDVHAINPGIAVLIMSMHEEDLWVKRALRAGAKGYLGKRAPREDLETALRDLAAGRKAFGERMLADGLLGGTKDGECRPRVGFAALTGREAQIFDLIGAGKSNHHIAESLGISSGTVVVHRMSIRNKLGLQDGVALTRYAIRWVESGGHVLEPADSFPDRASA